MGKQGPKTEEGKAIVRLNAVQHGVLSTTPVIPDLEREEDWDAHRAGMVASLAPQGYLEATLAERIALLLWRLQRVARYESDAIALSQERVQEDLMRSNEPPSVEEARRKQELLHHRLELLGRLLGLPDDAALSSRDATTMLMAAAEVAKVEVKNVPLPGVPEGVDLEEFSGWTVGLARQAIGAIAAAAKTEPTSLLDWLICSALYEVGELGRAIRKETVDLDHMRRERLLPNEDTLNKVIRYEAHLHRQLLQTMHELEALQARRQGRQTPLARVDVQGLADQ